MIGRALIAGLALVALAGAAPGDEELMRLKCAAADTQQTYLWAVLSRINDDRSHLAQWWASYVDGLAKPMAESK